MKFSYTAALFLALAARTIAHAIPSPALGVRGTPTRADVQRPSTSQPCGSVSIAKNIDNSTAVPVEQDGVTVMLNVTNFNAGGDGSRSVSVLVDPTATGNSKNFVKATVTKNGNANPSSDGTDQVKLTLPAGTKCTGGKEGNLCLLSVKTTAGFGACTVVQQLASSPASTTASASASAATTGTGATTSKPCSKSRRRRALGSRAPRAMRLQQSLHGNPVFASTPL
ncbi:hypothetical protein MSAN_00755400 [Mycena sanguinolenta]|uniref:Uncharacterized protein n=1 Tax=Mycena sanguinolenta TaxID=230812 RepID=A0A8H7DD91_9AGAR|nr:hypothetical protein MSAN_00755400 [Mycena sanguinolenta]